MYLCYVCCVYASVYACISVYVCEYVYMLYFYVCICTLKTFNVMFLLKYV